MKRYIRSDEQTGSNFYTAKPKYSKYDDDHLFRSLFDSDELDDFVFNLSHSNQYYILNFYDFAFWMTENPKLSTRAAQDIISRIVDDPYQLLYILGHLESAGNLNDAIADTALSSIAKCFPANRSRTGYRYDQIEQYIELVSEYCKDCESKSELLARLDTLLSTKLKWPSKTKWNKIDSDEAFEDMWSTYLSKSEDEINKKLRIFTEPSVQGSMGAMVIFDESGGENEHISIDFQDWCDNELRMAAASKNADEYATKYEAYLKSIVNWL